MTEKLRRFCQVRTRRFRVRQISVGVKKHCDEPVDIRSYRRVYAVLGHQHRDAVMDKGDVSDSRAGLGVSQPEEIIEMRPGGTEVYEDCFGRKFDMVAVNKNTGERQNRLFP